VLVTPAGVFLIGLLFLNVLPDQLFNVSCFVVHTGNMGNNICVRPVIEFNG
jgi:hypothetical protein